ncbi:MAG TPA: hypothetical protein VG165_04760 [Solirubrobacteraceae bacterium]|nr:hypothetical protein [Solirubrobacteraceae bacterium]
MCRIRAAIATHLTTAGRTANRLTGLGATAGLAVGLLLSLLMLAPSAQADCGGVQVAKPSKRPKTYLPPLALGDSTMIFALPSLAAEGYDANARGCRQFPEAIALLTGLRHAHTLPTSS